MAAGFLLLACAAVLGHSEKTLVSYVYFRKEEGEVGGKAWKKCAFEGKLCGCETEVRFGMGGMGLPVEGRVTNCTAPVCWCKGEGGALAQYNQCTANLEYFITHGVPPYLSDPNVDFLFNIVGQTLIPPSLTALAEANPSRVTVTRVPSAPTDLCTQGNVVRSHKATHPRFFLINCSARGPYAAPDTPWLQTFEQQIASNPNVSLVGPVINCWERKPHVQSWAWYTTEAAADLIAKNCYCDGKRNDQIRQCELGISGALLRKGLTIASLQPSYAGFDWHSSSNKNCNRGKSPVGCSRTDPSTSLACEGANLCEEVFTKYGGTNLPLGFTPQRTHQRIVDFENGLATCM